MANIGTYAILNPATTPVAAAYPAGNYALSVTPTSGSPLYSYYITSAADMKELANSVTTTAGSGVNYTSGPRKILKFPYAYLDNFTGTYTSATTSGTDYSEYDGYGTLITPWATYTNVVRIKNRYTSSIGYAINWYTLNPLVSVFSFDSMSNRYTGLNVSASNIDIRNVNTEAAAIWPNPLTENGTISIGHNLQLTDAVLELTDIAGKLIMHQPLTAHTSTIQRGQLKSGLYIYQVKNNGICVAKGKLAVQ
jgi:hypothetical protein